ncbi:SARP family transcriptional regulator [Microbispora rosea subsp. aerata]|nr:BTAD domain-containing putative transcriptional regulator [Microbispora rosea]GGO10540.1 SARP family transcriptional regulator [Microbispora rosea subsp. aerata]GIH53701.1 SARP family transcriptional regulator [Microbispora rosea subsp. aerata]GLJ81694.1 SARP family transcriptional regulator [Microbispora rosea subsp. aerata]
MRFRVLGALEVRSGAHRLIRLGAAKQRTLLAVLLLNVNRPVTTDRLLEALWPQRPPRTAVVALRTYVSALRQVLGLAGRGEPPLLSTVPGGYQLSVSPADLDLLVFQELADQGRQALGDGLPALAGDRLRRALALWRGRPFEDVPLDPAMEAELILLEERKVAAQETWIEAQLALGHHRDLLAELRAMVMEYPLRERLHAQWMLALYRSGRQAEALAAYHELRLRLRRELGVEPSPPLRLLHRRILTGHADLTDGEVAAPAVVRLPDPVKPHQLPRDIVSFTGRTAELARLHALARPPDGPAAPVICVIDGMAGVGKTALAVHAAHRLADTFADGQLFVDLHGFTHGVPPVDPADALDQMLCALGVPGEQIPPALDARAALYRTRLAGKRVLVLLDNAAGEAQVRSLLPGTPTCMVLITSRRRLAGLEDVRPLSLDVLPQHDAVTLFTRAASPERLAGQPAELLTEIVELCGRLPLAIRIAAARLRMRSGWTPAHLAERLRDHQHRLGELEVGRLSVTATMDLSYRDLGRGRQDMYRLLGLHPGSDFERYAAAALAGTTPRHAGRLIDDLVDAHLLQEPVPGRYRFHDLLRVHATAALADEDTGADRDAALTRLLDFYADTAADAVDIAHPRVHPGAHSGAHSGADAPARPRPHGDRGRRTAAAPDLRDRARAVQWLETELTNLLATAVYAAGNGRPEHALRLSAALHRHLHTGAHYICARTTHGEAPHPAGDTQLAALCGVADLHLMLGQFTQAAGHFGRVLEIARAAGDPVGELNALCGLGHVCRAQGETGAAARYLEHSLRIARACGYSDGELNALCGLGEVDLMLGRYASAADRFRRALQIAFRIGDRNAQFESLHGLGRVYQGAGHAERALAYHQIALPIAHALGHRADQARALHGLARAYRGLGRRDEAREHWRRALAILSDLGVPEAEETSVQEIRAQLRKL